MASRKTAKAKGKATAKATSKPGAVKKDARVSASQLPGPSTRARTVLGEVKEWVSNIPSDGSARRVSGSSNGSVEHEQTKTSKRNTARSKQVAAVSSRVATRASFAAAASTAELAGRAVDSIVPLPIVQHITRSGRNATRRVVGKRSLAHTAVAGDGEGSVDETLSTEIATRAATASPPSASPTLASPTLASPTLVSPTPASPPPVSAAESASASSPPPPTLAAAGPASSIVHHSPVLNITTFPTVANNTNTMAPITAATSETSTTSAPPDPATPSTEAESPDTNAVGPSKPSSALTASRPKTPTAPARAPSPITPPAKPWYEYPDPQRSPERYMTFRAMYGVLESSQIMFHASEGGSSW